MRRHRAIERDYFFYAWADLMSLLIIMGERRAPRGMETFEFLGLQFTVHDSEHNILWHPERDLNYKFMVAEWLWIMSGTDDLEVIARYNSQMRKFSDDRFKLAGAYGPRLIYQIPWLLDKLKESDTRQAVATIWTPTPIMSKDIPCTVALQFLRRDDTINLIVTMRSSDLWLGLPYDFFVFTQILLCMCAVLECKPGWTQFNFGSSHLYLDNLEKAKGLLDKSTEGLTLASPGVTGMPPRDFLDALRANNFVSPKDGVWEIYRQVLISKREDAIKHLTPQSR